MRFKAFIIKNYSRGNTVIRKEGRRKGRREESREERNEEIFFFMA